MNNRITIEVTLMLYGPILTQSSTALRYGVDATMARAEDGSYYIPGTLVKGRLRQAWEELNHLLGISEDDLRLLFGNTSGNRENGQAVNPIRGAIQVTDFFTSAGTDGGVAFRIRMDEERKAVDTGAYLVMEAPFAAGEEVEFKGNISFYANGDNEIKKITAGILAGLKWSHSFGAERTVGFGRLKNVAVCLLPQAGKGTAPLVGNVRFAITISPDAPFCLGERQYKENLFDSREFIAGNVIKGSIASTWGLLSGKGANSEIGKGFDSARPELSEWFDKVRFTHAFPAVRGSGKRPINIPLSLVKGVNGTLRDVALEKDAVLVDGAAPAFSIDWKEWDDVNTLFGWPYIDKELRVRTALDKAKRKAENKKLFAYEMVKPDNVEWLGIVDLSKVEDSSKSDEGNMSLKEAVKNQLVELLSHGLHGLSKTKTSASIAITEARSFQVPQQVNGYYIVTLQTPTLLIKPGELDETSCRDQLNRVYKTVWKELSDESLELFNYFTAETLSGGYYLHKRFRDGADYYPWILTDAGSVFVLKATDEGKAAMKIQSWLERGLDLPAWVEAEYGRGGLPGNHWKNCPYLPENGFGEIRLTESLLNMAKEGKE